eukprot:COSAG02_NODE_1781_length_10947_cov_54.689159_8_plen_1824_part_00
MAPKRHVCVTVRPEALVAGPNIETLGVHSLLDGPDGPRALFSQGPMPSTQTSRPERHTGWLEYGGVTARGGKMVTWATSGTPSPSAKEARGWAMAATRSGDYVATVQEPARLDDKAKAKGPREVVVKKWEWVCREGTGNVPEAERKKWKGADPTPRLPSFDDREPIPSQLWLSDDGRTLAALLIDPEDYSNRELYLLGRSSPSGKWPKHWMRKPEPTQNFTDGLNLSAQDLFLGLVQMVVTDTPQLGRCCHLAHVWRRIDEGDPYRGDPSQLMLNIRALCVSVDDAAFTKSAPTGGTNLQLLRPGCWIAREYPFNVGDKDAVLPPLAAQLDPKGSVLAVVANQAEHQPLLFVGMPGFEDAQRSGSSASSESPLTLVDMHDSRKSSERCTPVQDLAWSYDGSLLAAVSADAQLTLLPRLGMPLPLRPEAASKEMQDVLKEFVKPPAREPESAEARMPALARRSSLSSLPIAAVYPYFALPGVAAEVGGPPGGGAAVSTVGDQGADTGVPAEAPQPTKMRLFTICSHHRNQTSFAVCDGAVTVVLSAKTLDTRDTSQISGKQLIAQDDFSTQQLIKHLTGIKSSTTPTMASWPNGPLAAFAAAAQIALSLGISVNDIDISPVRAVLASAPVSMKQRTRVGDLIPVDVKLQGDLLVVKKSTEAASAFKPAMKLQRAKLPAGCPAQWLARSGRQLDLNDGRNPQLTLLCSSDAEATAWEKKLRAAGSGSSYRGAAGVLRCVRKILQVLAWGQGRSPELAMKVVTASFNDLVAAKQFYLAFHLLSTAEQYLRHTNAGAVVLTRQWETLRKKVADAAKGFGAAEEKATFGVDDPFWGYKDPVEKTKANWGPLQTVIALRLCGREESMAVTPVKEKSQLTDRQIDHVTRHVTRLKRLDAVAKQPTHSPAGGSPAEYLAIGHRLYYEQRWDDALEFYKTAAKVGKTALFSLLVFNNNFSAALKLALGGLHPDSGAAHLAYEAGKPCLKDDYVLVCTMSKLMWAVICGKPKFEMWRPTTTILTGAAPSQYLEDPKWYDKLRKRAIPKAVLADGAKSCSQDQWNSMTAVRLCLAAGLMSEATDILKKEPTVRSAFGIVLKAHPEIVNHMAEANSTVKQVLTKHLDDALRACDLQRIHKLLLASAKLFPAGGTKDSISRRLQSVNHFLRGMRQYLIQMPVPVVDSFQLPAPLERGQNKVEGASAGSAVQLEAFRRWNLGVVSRFTCFLLQPAMAAGKIKEILGEHGWCGAGAAKLEREEGEIGWIKTFGTWADFVLPYRLLLRFSWFQVVRDEYSSRWRQVHNLHSRRTQALARLRRGESLSYHRGAAEADASELMEERIHLCCAAVQLLPFDDMIHINKLHELLVSCIENIELEITINDPTDVSRLGPLVTLLMLYLQEFGRQRPRHQLLRKQIAVRCTVLDSKLAAAEADAAAVGMPVEQRMWSSRLTQQSDAEQDYGMWNYELDPSFQRFVAREPRIRNIETMKTFDFVKSPAAKGEHDLDPAKLAQELDKAKAEYEALADGPALVKGAGGQWVLPPEEIGYEVLEVAEFDASKEKEVEFEETFEKRAELASRQDELAYPVVNMSDGQAIGPNKEKGDTAIGDMTKKAPKPEAEKSKGKPPEKPKASSDQLPTGLQLLSRTGKREVNLGKTASSTGYFTTTVKTLRQDGPHSRAKRVGGKTTTIIPGASGVTGEHPITEPVPHKLHAARPADQTEMRVGEPLPTREYNVDPSTGAIVATDGKVTEYPVASLSVRGYTPSGGWYGEQPQLHRDRVMGGQYGPSHRSWQPNRRPDGRPREYWDPDDPRGSGRPGFGRGDGSGWGDTDYFPDSR